MIENFDEFWERAKDFLKRCKNINIYKKILKIFFNNKNDKEGLKISEISLDKNIYSKINLLRKKKIIEKTKNGSSRKMLVDLDLTENKPCFNIKQIQEKTSDYGNKLYNHSQENKNILEVIINITNFSDSNKIKSFLDNLLEKGHLKLYNQIIEALKIIHLFEERRGYGGLDWRPQKVDKYKLNKEFIN